MTLDSLGGYRLVRKLGEGDRAEIYLGHARVATTTTSVAIKVFRSGVTDESIVGEIEALTRASGAHVVELIDVTTASDGAPALILGRLAGGSLDRLVRARSALRVGEIITILAPLTSTLARMHRDGATHGAVGLNAVLFDSSGSPALACFGRSGTMTPNQSPAERERDAGIGGDLAALAGLAQVLLAQDQSGDHGADRGADYRADDRAARSLADWVQSSDVAADDWCDALTSRLFDLGDAEAVDLRMERGGTVERLLPGRVITAQPIAVELEPRSSAVAVLGMPEWLENLLPASAETVVARLRTALSAVRRRVWVVAGLVVVALIAASVLTRPAADAAQAPSEMSGVAPTPTSATHSVSSGPIERDDPVEALVALLAAREQCIRDLSVLCLDEVGHTGSSALASDQALIRELQSGGEQPKRLLADPADITLTERLGDSAILALGDGADGKPASFLLMKGEAGWRIRDYLPG